MDVLRADVAVERETGEDRQLVRGVEPLDVVRRVGLGVAQVLRLLERSAKSAPSRPMRGQDVVGRAVDDRAQAVDLVSGEIALERRDDRDAAADAGLVENVAPPRRAPSASSSGPCFAITSLLPVTTQRPFFRLRSMYSRAGVSPPITSTTMSQSVAQRLFGVVGQEARRQ